MLKFIKSYIDDVTSKKIPLFVCTFCKKDYHDVGQKVKDKEEFTKARIKKCPTCCR